MPRIRKCHVHGCKAPAFVPNHYCSNHISHEIEYQQEREKYAHKFPTRQSKKTQWKYNHVTRYRNPIKAEQNKFYHSKQWKDFRQIILNRDYHLCQYCKARGVIREGNIVDHVLPVERFPEKMRDLKNLVTCCNNCHYWKTRFEEKYYGTGFNNQPTDNPPLTNIKLIAGLSERIKMQK